MGQHFDELAKALASGVSRRTALRRFVFGSVGAAAATLMPGRTSLASGDDEFSVQRCISFCQRCLTGEAQLLCVEACQHEINFNTIRFNSVQLNSTQFNQIRFNQINLNCI